MRLGIYSGTFDPIHEGHILFAEVACEQFGLDKVLILPEPEPRYKAEAVGIKHRQRMSLLATAKTESNIETLFLDDLKSHTVHGVIRRIYEAYPEDEYYILMGADVFSGIESWGTREDEDGSIAEVAEAVGFVIGVENIDQLPALQKIGDKLKLNTRFIEVPAPGMSSSNVRRAIADRSQPKGLNDQVAGYIEHHQLYR